MFLCFALCQNNHKGNVIFLIYIDDNESFEIEAYPKTFIINFLSSLISTKCMWETRRLKLFEHII